MSTDTKAIIGTIVAANVSLGGLLSAQFAGFNTRIDDLRTAIATVKADHSADNADIRTDLRRMDDRLRAVEIAFGKVDQRLETLERLHRPAPAARFTASRFRTPRGWRCGRRCRPDRRARVERVPADVVRHDRTPS